MREQYGVIFPRFWEGTTGRQLQERGSEAVVLAAYLLSCRHANMIGLYELPLVFLERELPVLKNRRAILTAFAALDGVSYATYDLTTEHVWVREMARIRLGLTGDAINPDDKKHKAVVKLYSSLKPNPFVGLFYDRYRQLLRLKVRREDTTLLVGASEGLVSSEKRHRRGLVAASKPVTGTGTETSTSISTESTSESAAASPRDPDQPADNVGVITSLVTKDVLPLLGTKAEYVDLKEATKELCSRNRIAYDGATVRKAIDSALARSGARP